jgi:F0F1-type ATP synthase assembly protein I
MTEPVRKRSAHLELLAVSWSFGWPIAAGVILGHWIDIRFEVTPIATLSMGIGALVLSVRRMVDLGREDVLDHRRQEEKEEGKGEK